MTQPVYVIGAGVSGLSAAYCLKKQGVPVVILESSNLLGGRAAAVEDKGFVFELGGRNISRNNETIEEVLSLLPTQEIEAQHSHYHYLLDKKVHRQNGKVTAAAVTKMMAAMGIRGFLRFLHFYLTLSNHKKEVYFGSAFLKKIEAKHDHKPISKQFPRKLAYGLFRLLANVMAGLNVDEMYYSNLMMAMKKSGETVTIQGGVQKLYQAMARDIEVIYNASVTQIKVENNQVQGLTYFQNGMEHQVPCTRIICTVPGNQLSRLLPLPAETVQKVEQIRYSPLALVQVVYRDAIFPEDMTSLCMDEGGHLGHCSTNRPHQRNHVRYTLSGPKARKVIHAPDHELVDICERELATVLPFHSERLAVNITRYETGVCAFAPRYSEIYEAIVHYVDSVQGLEVAGDYLAGAKIEICMQTGFEASKRIVTAPATAQSAMRS